jgi:hypothetical protein
VGEEHLAHEVAPAADARLLEHVLQVLLHGVRGDAEPVGDLGRGVAAQDQPGDVLLAIGQPVGGHQQRGDAGRMGGLDDHGDPPRPAGDQGRAVQHHPAPLPPEHPRDRDLARCRLALGGAQGAAGDREHRRGKLAAPLPVAIGKLRQPALDAGRERLDAPVVGQDDQAGGVRSLGVGGLAHQQPALGALGQVRRHRPQEADLVLAEEGPVRLAVEAQHAPDLAGPRPQGEQQLLVAAVGTDVEVPLRASPRIAPGRLVQRRDPARGTRDVRHPVEVVLEVLVREPLPRDLGEALLVVARGQQRRRVEREPAGRQEVRHDRRDDLARLAPERDEVMTPGREPADPVGAPLHGVRTHGAW